MLSSRQNISTSASHTDRPTTVRYLFDLASTTPKFFNRLPMPSEQELRYFGLQAGDRASSQDTECSICQKRVKAPVVTECQHIYCFECIYQWFGRSTHCPDCRKDLYEERLTKDQTAPVRPSSPGKYSSSEWVRDDDRKASLERMLAAIVPQSQDREPTILDCQEAPPSRHRRRGYHERSPSSGSTAYQRLDFSPPRAVRCQSSTAHHPTMRSASSASCHPALVQEDGTIPRTSHDNNLQTVPTECEPQFSTDILLVDSDEMLAHMWQTSSAMSANTQVTVRCRAIAKCVWREWRSLLRLHDGQWILPEDLLAALSHVEYGWISHWRELPPAFTQIMEETAQAITEFT